MVLPGVDHHGHGDVVEPQIGADEAAHPRRGEFRVEHRLGKLGHRGQQPRQIGLRNRPRARRGLLDGRPQGAGATSGTPIKLMSQRLGGDEASLHPFDDYGPAIAIGGGPPRGVQNRAGLRRPPSASRGYRRGLRHCGPMHLHPTGSPGRLAGRHQHMNQGIHGTRPDAEVASGRRATQNRARPREQQRCHTSLRLIEIARLGAHDTRQHIAPLPAQPPRQGSGGDTPVEQLSSGGQVVLRPQDVCGPFGHPGRRVSAALHAPTLGGSRRAARTPTPPCGQRPSQRPPWG